ncbi:MAG: D-glycero-beta-D-manno-heptose-7-phosphate kinase [Elusimicrobia bacterium]|nr:D-glycero-beta-D-manno-heptose-7-phosphate kinase [Elusimicrobiota bacterium]
MNKINIMRLAEITEKFSSTAIAVLGDLMLDRYIRGSVKRISPEAPVPVVKVKEETLSPGGCGNVARNLLSLDAKASVISLTGVNETSKRLLGLLVETGTDVSGIISTPEITAIEKTRIIAEHQQIVRFDREPDINAGSKFELKLINNLKQKLSMGCRALILSDYGKGTLTPAVIDSAIRLCVKMKIPVCVDPKPEHFKKYKHATCMTPNAAEAHQGMGMIEKTGDEDIEKTGRRILAALKCRSLLITRGEHGMTLLDKSCPCAKITHIPTNAKEVFDVTGAGDTVISVFTLSLASGASILESAVLSNLAAGIVVGKLGTASVTRTELLEAIKSCKATV